MLFPVTSRPLIQGTPPHQRASQAGRCLHLRPARLRAGCARAQRLRPSGDARGRPRPPGPHPPHAARTLSAIAWVSAVAGCVAEGAPHIILAAGGAGACGHQAAVAREQQTLAGVVERSPDLARRSGDVRAKPQRAARGWGRDRKWGAGHPGREWSADRPGRCGLRGAGAWPQLGTPVGSVSGPKVVCCRAIPPPGVWCRPPGRLSRRVWAGARPAASGERGGPCHAGWARSGGLV